MILATTAKRLGKDMVFYLAVLVAFWLIAHEAVTGLKAEINTAVRAECLANTSAPILTKYNELVQIFENQQLTAEKLNTKKRDVAKAAADAAYAAQIQDAAIPIVPPNCAVDLLP